MCTSLWGSEKSRRGRSISYPGGCDLRWINVFLDVKFYEESGIRVDFVIRGFPYPEGVVLCLFIGVG